MRLQISVKADYARRAEAWVIGWSVGDQPALSIHVYAPRLVSMTFYDDRPASFLDVVRHEALERPGRPVGGH